MKHYGDITQLRGDQIEPVSCITGGSPCQDLSIAGKRAGLAGERSGLFMEMIRIIKEMRNATNGKYPKFAIQENVRGALSSNNGEDFRCVLEEFSHIIEADATIPRPAGKNGKWSKSGAISGNGWSLAWRLFDAQYWGVPQRRQRIALVMDFGGQRAAEILFERTGVPGNPDESVPSWEGITGIAENCTARDDRVVGQRGAYTLKIRSGCEGGGKGALVQTEKTGTLSTLQDQTFFQPVYCLTERYINAPIQTTTGTLSPGAHPGSYNGQDAYNDMLVRGQDKRLLKWIVRRLTPTECERLQGYPGGWTDIGEWTDTKGKNHKPADSPRYKALGNSIALPQWFWIAQKIKPYLPAGATLGSLFDGIGGFPLIWEAIYGKGTARWASEIEEFCVAVTKKHFPEN